MEPDSYKMIVTIVNKGKAGKVVDISHQAGAVGGTIIPGHGAAVRLMLGVNIEPEKEIVLTLIDADKVQTVLEAIVQEMELNEPNKGIVFVLSLDQVTGIRQ
jgi:nitrogen regulatory protein PII